MDAVESNQQTLLLEVRDFVQTCMQMASLPGERNAPLPPGEAVIFRSPRRGVCGHYWRRLHLPDKWKPLNSRDCL